MTGCYKLYIPQAPPDFQAKEILERVRAKATTTFAKDPLLRLIPRRHKKLTILFSGFLYHHSPPKMAFATISNFQDFQSGTVCDKASDDFRIDYWIEKRPLDLPPMLIFGVGNDSAITAKDTKQLYDMLTQNKPVQAIVDKAVALLRQLSERPMSEGTIGKQITSIALPVNPFAEVACSYHSDYFKSESLLEDSVVALPEAQFAIKDFVIPAAVFPKVKPNQPCPCKSGKKFKLCHGKRIARAGGYSEENLTLLKDTDISSEKISLDESASFTVWSKKTRSILAQATCVAKHFFR